jgi:uncharacterized repeat protein (TIGR03833 family)
VNQLNAPRLPRRSEIFPGLRVLVIEKHNQASGQTTEGIVDRILTSSPSHPHGIKVRLVSGQVGRVQVILDPPAGRKSAQA